MITKMTTGTNGDYSTSRIYTCKQCHRLIEIDYHGKSSSGYDRSYYLDVLYKSSSDHFNYGICKSNSKSIEYDVIICT